MALAALLLSLPHFASVAQPETGSTPQAPPPIVFDAHQDCLRRVLERGDNLGQTYGDEQGNIAQWRKGNFNAIWLSVWVDPRKYQRTSAVAHAKQLIEARRQQVARNPTDLAICHTAADVRRTVAEGKIATLLGIEGGVAINNDLELISYYRQQGVRYMTLTWRGNLDWAGSSQSDNPTMGLTDFGRQVVHEMNRVGMVVDLAHVSDRTFFQALEETSRPVIVSHSNARLLSPHPRNVTDDMLRKLRDNGGVIGVNFSGDFLKVSASGDYTRRAGPANIQTVVEQVEHIVKVAGIDHVGIGTDYDGGIRPAQGLENAAAAPRLFAALRTRGFSETDLAKFAGENLLRVLAASDQPMPANPPPTAQSSATAPADYRAEQPF